MPGAPHPIIDAWAPPQYAAGTSGASGPVRSPNEASFSVNASDQTFDTTLHFKLAGTIILALVTVFVLEQMGFRFVVAAGVGPR